MAHFVTLPELMRVDCMILNRMKTAFAAKGDKEVTYGSCRDGTSGFTNDEGDIEFDIDSMIYQGYLSEEDQEKCIRSIQGSPGYVTIDVTDMCDEQRNKCFPDCSLNLVERNGRLLASATKVKVGYNKKDATSEEIAFYSGHLTEHRLKNDLSSAAVSYKYNVCCGGTCHLDEVYAVACCGWPSLAVPWAARKRHWPDASLVKDITNSAFHLVHKPSPSGDVDIEWRLSFSLAESKLMDSLTGPRLATFSIFKELLKKSVKLGVENVLTTYHIKTAFFWICEQKTSDSWQMILLEKYILDLLTFLIYGFKKGIVKHYFIPNINLLENISKMTWL